MASSPGNEASNPANRWSDDNPVGNNVEVAHCSWDFSGLSSPGNHAQQFFALIYIILVQKIELQLVQKIKKLIFDWKKEKLAWILSTSWNRKTTIIRLPRVYRTKVTSLFSGNNETSLNLESLTTALLWARARHVYVYT